MAAYTHSQAHSQAHPQVQMQAGAHPQARAGTRAKMSASGVKVFYGAKQALKGIDLSIVEREVTALIGPSGCGKSTFLRCLNRMNDTIDNARVEGLIMLEIGRAHV